MKNLLVSVEIFSLCRKETLFINGHCGHLFSQINFDKTYFWGVFVQGVGTGRLSLGVFCLGVYVLEPFFA